MVDDALRFYLCASRRFDNFVEEGVLPSAGEYPQFFKNTQWHRGVFVLCIECKYEDYCSKHILNLLL